MIINFWICQTHPGHFKGLSVFKLEFQDNIRPRQTKTVVRGRPTRPCRQRTKILALTVQLIDVFGRWAKIIIFTWTSGQIFDDWPLKNIKMWTKLEGWTDGRTSVQGGLDYKVSYFWTENIQTGNYLTYKIFLYFCFSLISLQNSWFTTGSTLECDFHGLLRLSETIISGCTAYTY